MRILGFNFKKISVEKLSDKVENLKINTNIDISEINDVKSDFFKKGEEFIGVNFTFLLNYEPNFAKLEFKGNLLIAVEPKIAKDILKKWENKEMPENFKMTLFNIILRKVNIRAIQLEDEINLPLHIQLPSLKKQEDKEKKQEN